MDTDYSDSSRILLEKKHQDDTTGKQFDISDLEVDSLVMFQKRISGRILVELTVIFFTLRTASFPQFWQPLVHVFCTLALKTCLCSVAISITLVNIEVIGQCTFRHFPFLFFHTTFFISFFSFYYSLIFFRVSFSAFTVTVSLGFEVEIAADSFFLS